MFFIPRPRPRYGTVAANDSGDSEEEEKRPIAPTVSGQDHQTFIETLKRIQEHQQPAEVNRLTCWFIRLFPILTTLSWTVTWLFLLFAWIFVDRLDRYSSTIAAVPSLSEVMSEHTTITLFGNIATAVLLLQSLEQERFLRYKRVLVEATEERWLWITVGLLDCFLGALGATALFLMPIFNLKEFPQLHQIVKSSFFVFIALSGFLNTVEVEHLWHEHPDRHDLRAGTFLKYSFMWIFITCGVISRLLAGFCQSSRVEVDYDQCYRVNTASAILEWVICLALSGFLSTLALDVWPISRHLPVHPRFSATSQGLSHVHHANGKVEIPPGLEIRRLPMMTRTGIVGYGNGWTDRGVGDSEFAWYEMGTSGNRRRDSAKKRRSRKFSI